MGPRRSTRRPKFGADRPQPRKARTNRYPSGTFRLAALVWRPDERNPPLTSPKHPRHVEARRGFLGPFVTTVHVAKTCVDPVTARFPVACTGLRVLTSARLSRDSVEVVLVCGGWSWVVSAGFRPGTGPFASAANAFAARQDFLYNPTRRLLTVDGAVVG